MRTGASGLRLRVVVLLVPVVFGACGEQREAPQEAGSLALLEQFAFVPQARSQLSSSSSSGLNPILIDEALLVGMYEVTRTEFRTYLDAATPVLDPLLKDRAESWSSTDGTLPATFITRDEATLYARWAGVRLLTSTEWLFCIRNP